MSTSQKILHSSVFPIPFDAAASEIPSKAKVGSKAHNLMRMSRAGLPVPPGFVVGTDVCRAYLAHGPDVLSGLGSLIQGEMERLGQLTGRLFGDDKRPLLVSARSGAAISMPGMMETVLNLGLNSATVRGLLRLTGNPRLAQDCRRRLVQQFGEVVNAIPPSFLEVRAAAVLKELGAASIEDLDTNGLRQLADAFENEYSVRVGCRFPSDPIKQVRAAIEAVLKSWLSARAVSYRKLNGISDDLGTSVTVQVMVFGNLGPTSGSGVGFTRDPATGRNEFFVDYLPNAQGEDVVSGRRKAFGVADLERQAPQASRDLVAARDKLEREFRDMQDFEFTVEDGRLFFLQSRVGKRTSLAALHIAHDLVEEGLITPSEALELLDGVDLDTVTEQRLEAPAGVVSLVTGIPAGSGVATGAAVFSINRAATFKGRGQPYILVRQTAETQDIDALADSVGLITVEGARTSHAAVVARQLGRPCVVGCGGIVIAPCGESAAFGEQTIREGDLISIDGASGEIYAGVLKCIRMRPTELLGEVMRWRRQDRTDSSSMPGKRQHIREKPAESSA